MNVCVNKPKPSKKKKVKEIVIVDKKGVGFSFPGNFIVEEKNGVFFFKAQ